MNSRNLLVAVCLLAIAETNGQITALDFIADDCSGTSHHLFSELEAGNVVVLDLVMMQCPDCAPATVAIAENVIPNTTDPSRVKFYSIGFIDDITCTEITDWAVAGGVTHPVFAGMSDQTSYYGGMGMPTIVVLGGGNSHAVYYVHLGYAVGLNGIITDAIDQALLDANGITENGTRRITLGPNPASTTLNLKGYYIMAKVTDFHGRLVLLNRRINGATLDVSALPAGLYTLELTTADMSREVGRFVKR